MTATEAEIAVEAQKLLHLSKEQLAQLVVTVQRVAKMHNAEMQAMYDAQSAELTKVLRENSRLREQVERQG